MTADPPRPRVHLFIPCLVNDLYPSMAKASMRLLDRAGYEVICNDRQTCCGQAAWNAGYPDQAAAAARHTRGLFPGGDPVVGPSGSCLAFMRNHYTGLTGDSSFAARCFELTEFLVEVARYRSSGRLAVPRGLDIRVAYHPSCHQVRALGKPEPPLTLLRAIEGLTVFPVDSLRSAHPDAPTLDSGMHGNESECCGFGGFFFKKMEDLSIALAEAKVRRIRATGCDSVVSTDAGCLMNIETTARRMGTPLRVAHVAELIAEAEGLL